MALVINDRVKVTSTTTGTGAMALGSAVTGFETFAAGIGNSNTTYYAIFTSIAIDAVNILKHLIPITSS